MAITQSEVDKARSMGGAAPWKNKYYLRYVDEFTKAGLTPTESFNEFKVPWSGDLEGTYLTKYGTQVYSKTVDNYNAEARKYGKLTGVTQDIISNKYPDSEEWKDLPSLTSEIEERTKTLPQQAAQYWEDTVKPKLDKAIADGDYDTANSIYGTIETQNAYGYDLTPYKDKIATLKTTTEAEEEAAYAESPETTEIKTRIQSIIDNPETVDPEKVRTWTQYYNNLYSEEDRKAATRLTESFSAVGDIGSSAHQQAVADLIRETQLGREQMGYSAASNELGQKLTQTGTGIDRLLGIASANDQRRLIPLQNEFQSFLARQNAGFQTEANRLDAGYKSVAQQRQIDSQERSDREMVNLYKSTQPREAQWWQPLLDTAIMGAGYAIGGPVGGMVASGVSGLLKGSQPTSSIGYQNLASASRPYYNQPSRISDINSSFPSLLRR